jgi:hypothetical protein
LTPLPLLPLRRRHRHHRLHGPVEGVNNLARRRKKKKTSNRVEVFHSSIFLSLSIDSVIELILFIVYPPASPIDFV